VRLWDVNLWVYAFRADSPLHGRVRPLLVEALEAREPFLFCPSAASFFLRLVTNPRIFMEPSDWREAWAFIDWLEAHPAAVFAEFDAVTFGIFKHLCLVAGAQGNEVPDAFFAALALRYNATLVTAAAGMKKWQGVDVAVLESMQR
jgi:toxin-antitoxin system PIN domain toxin